MSSSSPSPTSQPAADADHPMQVPGTQMSDSGGEEREPCPTPLAWHEILSAFMNEADHWFLETSSGRIHGRTWGEGPPIYFLNGLSGTHELYSLVVWLLRENYRCVVFDYPDTADVSRELLSELLPEVVSLHGETNPITLVTRDFGFQVAILCLHHHSDLCSSLIVQTPVLEIPLTSSERRLGRWGVRIPGKLKRLPGRRQIQQRTHSAWFPPFDHSRIDFYYDNTGEQLTRALAQRFLLSAEPLPDFSSITLPEKMLLIRAEGETPAQTEAAKKLTERYPHLQSEWLHSSGQLAFLTHPHRFVKTMKEFLNGTLVTSNSHTESPS